LVCCTGRNGTLRIVSYNLREHSAVGELDALSAANDVDVLCLQEADTSDIPPGVGHLALADATRSNRLGLAVYVRSDKYLVQATKLVSVHKSLHDRVLAPAHERLLAVHLQDRETGQEVLVGDFHAAPLTASNRLRRKQIAAAHDGMRSLAMHLPALMVGDFNYPWFINGLERHLHTSGYTLTRTTEPTYLRYKYFSGYFDFVTSTGFTIDGVDVLPAGASDHRPISLKAHITQG
jgi:endonuclease/exonuclease/phosphatase (EEP) superfamily protein YafD